MPILFRKSFIILSLLLLLTSCAILSTNRGALNQNLSWHERKHQLQSIQQFTVKGEIVILTESNAIEASFSWFHKNGYDDLKLFGPFGVGSVNLKVTPEGVILYTPNGKFAANSPEQLLREQLGWFLPIANLYCWIRSIPAPSIKSIKIYFDKYNHMIELNQADWVLKYLSYTAVDGVDLPNKIYISYKGLRFKIIISKWIIDTSNE